jgi:hypothetical protein
MCAPSYGSEPENNNADKNNVSPKLNAEELIGNFKDLDKPLLKSGLLEYSPVAIVDETEISNIRLHGPWGSEDRGYLRPPTNSKNVEVFPQNAAAAVLEWFFPSHVGFVANTIPSQAPNKFFKPAAIARIFNEEISVDFYQDAQTGAMRIANALQPGAFKSLEQWNKRAKEVSKKAKPSDLTELLFTALDETRGDRATELGLPPQVVKKILLTWLWVKYSRAGCQAYYENLSDTIVDRTAVNEIVWAGPGSCYTGQDYWQARKAQHGFSREMSVFLKLGYAYYEDELPPVLHFGVSTYKSDKGDIRFSNCGEMSLLNFFMTMLYDFKSKKFDVIRLSALKKSGFEVNEKLILFFEKICPSPIYIKLPGVLDFWINLVSNLNAELSIERVDYLFPNGEAGSAAINEKGICCINVGLDNMLRVIGKLLGHPKWDEKDIVWCLDNKLDLLCSTFNPCQLYGVNDRSWNWAILNRPTEKSIDYKNLQNFKRIEDTRNVSIVFMTGMDPVFEWHFEPKHFDFSRAEKQYSSAATYLKRSIPLIPEARSEMEFPSYFYNADFNTLTGKLSGLRKALWFKKIFNKPTFNHIIDRWLDSSGHHFAGYNDYNTNTFLINYLLEFHTREEVLSMRIPKLSSYLFWRDVQSKDTDEVHCLLNIDKVLVRQERCDRSTYEYPLMARILTTALEEARDEDMGQLLIAGANDYALEVAGVTLLHLAAHAGSTKAVLRLLKEGFIPNFKVRGGNTPLHFAVMVAKYESENIAQVLADACPSALLEKNDNGDTPLHLIMKKSYPWDTVNQIVQSLRDVKHLTAQFYEEVHALVEQLRRDDQDGRICQ